MDPKAGRKNKAMSQSENIDEVPHPFTSHYSISKLLHSSENSSMQQAAYHRKRRLREGKTGSAPPVFANDLRS
jgi:hypothetical protein